ncbi:hypothetical protein [Duganella qianjiadongensis]|uniref:MSHA biogenesis protein MshK n=1 Tax=Duganella qianjiadongensis TaxID=2692176 RepID=A0ABW9VR46_9BURK|nr:hypothetical protein [Duganella qianjiadongensis]MYM42051.1 hypothetical protein [Duganella qianjiadongensis]
MSSTPIRLSQAALALSLLLAATMAPARAQTLGRLFATPAERDAMEGQRSAGVGGNMQQAAAPSAPPAPFQPAPAAEPAPAPAGSATLSMSGSLRSSTGRSTVWLNNVAQNDGQNSFSNTGANAVTITLSNGKRVVLKPGQRYDLDTARVKDVNEP